MIDEARTLQLYGYTSDMLKQQSNKKVVRICNNCGEVKIITKQSCRDLCVLCGHKYINQPPKPKFVSEFGRFIEGTGIDRILTIKQFGYDPVNLKSQSGRKVIAVCKECSKVREIRYDAYRNLCQSCSNKQKERGIKISCTLQGINRNEFNGLLTDQKYCKLFSNSFKEMIRNRFHNKCYLCNKSEKDNKQKLSVHHVNYDKSCLCQKTCEFVPLCGSCHAKTNYNRQIWEDLIMNYLYPNRYFMGDL